MNLRHTVSTRLRQTQALERVREATRERAKVRIELVLPVDILSACPLFPVL